jgi:hypothetical protein
MEQGLARRNGGRVKLSQADEAPARRTEEAWRQLRVTRDCIAALETRDWYINPSEGHAEFADRAWHW